MEQLEDIAKIKKIFWSVSRWRIIGAAFYKPTSFYLADLYLGAALMTLAGISIFVFNDNRMILLMLLPLALIIWRLTPALKTIYPQLSSIGPDAAKSYREDFQHLRLDLFLDRLKRDGITATRVSELKGILRLEAERMAAHPPSVNRSAFAIPLTLFLGILAAGAGIDKFWIHGYYSIVLSVLAVALFLVYQILELLHPAMYYAKELEMFLEIYSQSSQISS